MADPGPVETANVYVENGRTYGKFRRGQYLLPCDATERDRLDIMHTLLLVARDKERRLLNVPPQALNPDDSGDNARVLDLGCGTGLWLLEIAEKNPEVECVGVDLTPMGPPTVFSNVSLRAPVDYESPWTLGEQSWNVIHLQMALGSVMHWEQLYHKIIQHLRPGTGWFESVEIDFMPRCDDGTLGPGKLVDWYKYIKDAFESTRRPIEYNLNTGRNLEQAGFKDVQHAVYKLPLNGWSRNPKHHRAGMWYNIAISEGESQTGGFGMNALSLAPLTRLFQWPVHHVRMLCDDALVQASDPDVHAYNEIHVWWARAPGPQDRR